MFLPHAANFAFAAEAYVGRGTFFAEVRPHARGKHGIMEHPRCHLTVRVREVPLVDGERRLGKEGAFSFLFIEKLSSLRFCVPVWLISAVGWTNAVWSRVDPSRAPAQRVSAPKPRPKPRSKLLKRKPIEAPAA